MLSRPLSTCAICHLMYMLIATTCFHGVPGKRIQSSGQLFKHNRSSEVVPQKDLDKQAFWQLSIESLMDRSIWQPLTAECTKTVDGQKLSLQHYVARGEQARVFSLGTKDSPYMYAAKFFMAEAEAETEFQALEMLGDGAGSSQYIMHLAPGVSKGSGLNLCCGIPCVVVDFIDGSPLQSLRRQYRGYYNAAGEKVAGVPLQLPFVTSAICQVMRGLVALEESGLENCDQSSRNIMVSDDGHITLIDFGKATSAPTWDKDCFSLSFGFSPFKVLLDGLEDKVQIRDLVEEALTFETAAGALNHLMQASPFNDSACQPVPLS